MAAREASLKVTLQPASFQAGLRRMTGMTQTAGKQMGRALKEPMNAGLKSAKKEFTNTINGMKSGLATVATLGGALSFGALAKDALQMQNTYRNIAFNVNKVAGNAETWESIQKMITGAVQETGRSAEDLSTAFMAVFEATGDLEYSRKAMMNVGETATATGHSVDALANVMQLAARKFGVGTDDADEAMARFIEKTGVGGKGIEEMSNRFALMAGEAANAGMKGKEGISQMLGMLLLLDSSIGEKADPGLKMMFQSIKAGSAQFLRLKKAMGTGVKFDADMSAMDKILATLKSKRGRAMAEQVFTADARVVYDELAKPFDEAMEKALAAGFSKKEAMDKAVAAFSANLDQASASTMQYSQIQNEAAARQKTDPLVKMNKALARVSEAFVQPKMIDAMNKLADKMPAFADTLSSVIDYILDNPWESLAMLVGGKLALAFAGSAVSNAIATGVTSLFTKAAAVQAASTAASVATGGATTLGVGGGIAATGAAGGTGAAAAAAAGATAAVLAAGAAGGAIGYAAHKGMGVEDQQAAEQRSIREAQFTVSAAQQAVAGGDMEAMKQAMQQLQAAGNAMENAKIGGGYAVLDSLAAAVTGEKSQGAMREDLGKEIAIEQQRLKMAMEALQTNAARAAQAVQKLGGAADASRGPMTPANPEPGASPVG